MSLTTTQSREESFDHTAAELKQEEGGSSGAGERLEVCSQWGDMSSWCAGAGEGAAGAEERRQTGILQLLPSIQLIFPLQELAARPRARALTRAQEARRTHTHALG